MVEALDRLSHSVKSGLRCWVYWQLQPPSDSPPPWREWERALSITADSPNQSNAAMCASRCSGRRSSSRASARTASASPSAISRASLVAPPASIVQHSGLSQHVPPPHRAPCLGGTPMMMLTMTSTRPRRVHTSTLSWMHRRALMLLLRACARGGAALRSISCSCPAIWRRRPGGAVAIHASRWAYMLCTVPMWYLYRIDRVRYP